MSSEEIQALLKQIDLKGPGELYRQLQEGLRRMIDKLPDRHPVPSEREIALLLGVSRGSVRKALEFFVDEGCLIRNRKGTFVNKPGAEGRGLGKDIHPLTFGMDSPLRRHPDRKKIRIQLYENLPFQLDFWRETTEEFNESQGKWLAEAEWQLMAPGEDYFTFTRDLIRSECDLLQMPVSRGWPENFGSHFAEIRSDMRALFRKPEYFQAELCGTFPEMLDCAVPFSAGFRWLVWNKTMTDDLGVFAEKCGSLPDFYGKIAEKLPGSVALIDRLFCLTQMTGFSEDRSPETRAALLRAVYELLKYLPTGKKTLFSLSEDPYLIICQQKFLDRQTALYYFVTSMQMITEPYPFRTGSLPFFPVKGFHTRMNANALAINKNTGVRDGAEAFLRHLLSEPVQNRIARDFRMVPMYRPAWKHLADVLKTDPDTMTRFILSGREQSWRIDDAFPLILKLWAEMPRIRAGRRNPDGVIAELAET